MSVGYFALNVCNRICKWEPIFRPVFSLNLRYLCQHFNLHYKMLQIRAVISLAVAGFPASEV